MASRSHQCIYAGLGCRGNEARDTDSTLCLRSWLNKLTAVLCTIQVHLLVEGKTPPSLLPKGHQTDSCIEEAGFMQKLRRCIYRQHA